MKRKTNDNLKKQTAIPTENRYTTWIPYLTAVFLIILYFISLLNKGALTWAFHSVVYGPSFWGFYFTWGCVVLILLLAKYQNQMEMKFENIYSQYIFLGIIIIGFIYIMIWNQPVYPTLEGDGNLDPPNRLRYWLVGFVEKIFLKNEMVSASILWRILALFYLGFCFVFVYHVTKKCWERFWGLAFFSSFPAILNFGGYIDSYAVFYTLGTMFLGILYLFAKRREIWLLIPAFIVLLLSALEHPKFELLLLFPFIWFILSWFKKKNTPISIRKIMILVTILMTLIPGLWMARNRGDFGLLFSHVYYQDGLLFAFYHPLILMMSFLLPYIFLIIILEISGPERFWFFNNPELGAAFYGTVAIFITYYILQLFSPIALFGITDFLCQAGCLGVMFAVPTYIIIMETPLKKYLYCIVFISLFLTIPNIVIHRHKDISKRLINVIDGERSQYYDASSPHAHFGSKFIDMTQTQNRELRFIAYKIFEQGTNHHGFYSKFIPRNYYLLIRWQYELGDFELGRQNLDDMLRTIPDKFEGLLGPGAGFSKQKYTTNSIMRLNDTKILANRLYQETGNPIYLKIEEACFQNILFAKQVMESDTTLNQ